MRKSPILDALFPDIRSKLLVSMFTQPAKEWYLTELARFLQVQPSSLQRELDSLTHAGILQRRRDGRRLYVKPDTASPVFRDLKNLLDKTGGLVPVLRQELDVLGASVRVAFIYGSIARSEEASESDIDLMVIGAAGLSDLVPALRRAEKKLGRPINPIVYSTQEFTAKTRGRDHFLGTVLRGARQFVKGSKDELGKIAGRP